jgi:hypothetical protein
VKNQDKQTERQLNNTKEGKLMNKFVQNKTQEIGETFGHRARWAMARSQAGGK